MMLAYSGNTAHTHVNKAIEPICRDANGAIRPYDHDDYLMAKFILAQDNQNVGKNDLRDLGNRLLNSIFRSNLTDGRYIDNACSTVIEWDKGIKRRSIAAVRSFIIMNCLQSWQRELTKALWGFKETEKIYFFEKPGHSYAWVTVANPTTQLVYRYSKMYIDFIDKADTDFDFVVYGRNEFPDYAIPEDAIILERGV